MRTQLHALMVMVMVAVPAFGQQGPSGPVPDLLGDGTAGLSIAPGTTLADVEIGTSVAIDLAAQPLVCQATSPSACPAVPEVTGFTDGTTPYDAAQWHGRVLLVRNVGTGVLTLKAEGAGSAAQWRLKDARVLKASETVTLVYDGQLARWRVLSAQ